MSVLTERRGHVLVITLDRPEARNAVNLEVSRALADAVELLDSDVELRVGVLTGSGSAFCAGADLKAIASGESIMLPDHPEWGFAGFVNHFCSKPIIAAVNGFAFGGGFELALACDIIVASEEARFALPEVTRGLFAAGGGLPRIAQQVPQKVAARLVLTGVPMSAAEAERWGLVSEVVAPDALMDAALALADTIAANAPLAVQTSKRVLERLAHDSVFESGASGYVSEEWERTLASEDAIEGATAFVEKRLPVWKGR